MKESASLQSLVAMSTNLDKAAISFEDTNGQEIQERDKNLNAMYSSVGDEASILSNNKIPACYSLTKNNEGIQDVKKSFIKVKKVKPIIIDSKIQNASNVIDKTSEVLSHETIDAIMMQAQEELEKADYHLSEARDIAKRYGLTVDSSILDPAFQTPLIPSNQLSKLNIPSDADKKENVSNEQAHFQYDSKLTVGKNENQNINDINSAHVSNNIIDGGIMASSIRARTNLLPNLPNILSTTGGHSNTDHLVLNTGHAQFDRVTELKRNLRRRARAMQPECKGEDRWDQPRFPGQRLRRRRISREMDLPSAPPEPPKSGYVLFVGQMTAKTKHDRQQRYQHRKEQMTKEQYEAYMQHDQIKVVREISKIWRYGMAPEEKQYYTDFATSAKIEYNHQIREFRATGGYVPSSTFMKLGEGPWVRKIWHEKNDLERELATYPMDIFRLKPDKRSKNKPNTKDEDNQRINYNDSNGADGTGMVAYICTPQKRTKASIDPYKSESTSFLSKKNITQSGKLSHGSEDKDDNSKDPSDKDEDYCPSEDENDDDDEN